jgi:hypothetical protein
MDISTLNLLFKEQSLYIQCDILVENKFIQKEARITNVLIDKFENNYYVLIEQYLDESIKIKTQNLANLMFDDVKLAKLHLTKVSQNATA